MNKHTEVKIGGELVYDGKILKVSKDEVRLENGETAVRELIRHPGGVCVAAFLENGDILLVNQYRYGIGKESLELPAGKLEFGEDHRLCGKRELLEETGYEVSDEDFRYLGYINPIPAYDTEIIHLYKAVNLKKKSQSLDEDEFLDIISMPFDDALTKVIENEITDAKTVFGILKLAIVGF